MGRLRGWREIVRAFTGTSIAGKPREVFVSRLAKCLAVLLIGILAGCAARAPHTDVMEPQGALTEATAKRLISVWQQELGRYISREGSGDPAVLSQMRVLRSRDVLRPARITFGVLDVESNVPGRDGWDIEGVLIGKEMSGERQWYVFLVGIVARTGYRPSSIQDIRLVGLSGERGKLVWEMSLADAQAVQRYRGTSGESAPVRFPGDTDRFNLNVSGDRASVRETQSGADWSLQLSIGNFDASGQTASHVQSSSSGTSAGRGSH